MKKFLVTLLSLIMLVTLMPVSAWAEGPEPGLVLIENGFDEITTSISFNEGSISCQIFSVDDLDSLDLTDSLVTGSNRFVIKAACFDGESIFETSDTNLIPDVFTVEYVESNESYTISYTNENNDNSDYYLLFLDESNAAPIIIRKEQKPVKGLMFIENGQSYNDLSDCVFLSQGQSLNCDIYKIDDIYNPYIDSNIVSGNASDLFEVYSGEFDSDTKEINKVESVANIVSVTNIDDSSSYTISFENDGEADYYLIYLKDKNYEPLIIYNFPEPQRIFLNIDNDYYDEGIWMLNESKAYTIYSDNNGSLLSYSSNIQFYVTDTFIEDYHYLENVYNDSLVFEKLDNSFVVKVGENNSLFDQLCVYAFDSSNNKLYGPLILIPMPKDAEIYDISGAVEYNAPDPNTISSTIDINISDLDKENNKYYFKTNTSIANIYQYEAYNQNGDGFGPIDLGYSGYWTTATDWNGTSWDNNTPISITNTNNKYYLQFDGTHPWGFKTLKIDFKDSEGYCGSLIVKSGLNLVANAGIKDVAEFFHDATSKFERPTDEATLNRIFTVNKEGNGDSTTFIYDVGRTQASYQKSEGNVITTSGERMFLTLDTEAGYVVEDIVVHYKDGEETYTNLTIPENKVSQFSDVKNALAFGTNTYSYSTYAVRDDYLYQPYHNNNILFCNPDVYVTCEAGSNDAKDLAYLVYNIIKGDNEYASISNDNKAQENVSDFNPLETLWTNINTVNKELQSSDSEYVTRLENLGNLRTYCIGLNNPEFVDFVEVITKQVPLTAATDNSAYILTSDNELEALQKNISITDDGSYLNILNNTYSVNAEISQIFDLAPADSYYKDGNLEYSDNIYTVTLHVDSNEMPSGTQIVWFMDDGVAVPVDTQYVTNTNIGGYDIIFTTNHFSEYGIVQDKQETKPASGGGGGGFAAPKNNNTVQKEDNLTTAIIKPSLTEDGTTSITLSDDQAKKVINNLNEGSNELKLIANSDTKKAGLSITVQKDVFEALSKNAEPTLSILTNNNEVKFDAAALQEVIDLKLEGDFKVCLKAKSDLTAQEKSAIANGGVVLEISVSIGNQNISSFGDGILSFSTKIPSEIKNADPSAVYINNSGMSQITESKVNGDIIIINTGHCSAYGIVPKVVGDKLVADSNAVISGIVNSLKTKTTTTKLKNGIKVTAKCDVSELIELGYSVKYKFYRSLKKNNGYKLKKTTDNSIYTNTGMKKGRKYFYKYTLSVYDESGNLIDKSSLKQCKYSSKNYK